MGYNNVIKNLLNQSNQTSDLASQRPLLRGALLGKMGGVGPAIDKAYKGLSKTNQVVGKLPKRSFINKGNIKKPML